ncbi:unnamed protein product, partial [Prorocentrum cordatum]
DDRVRACRKSLEPHAGPARAASRRALESKLRGLLAAAGAAEGGRKGGEAAETAQAAQEGEEEAAAAAGPPAERRRKKRRRAPARKGATEVAEEEEKDDEDEAEDGDEGDPSLHQAAVDILLRASAKARAQPPRSPRTSPWPRAQTCRRPAAGRSGGR